jgi:hypothetical protein
MFSGLPNLFDRNFIIAFFLPALIFILASFGLIVVFDIQPYLTSKITEDIYKGATSIGLTSWICAVFLLALNFEILRLFEGYGHFNPLRLLQWIQRKKFFQLQREKFQVEKDVDIVEEIGDEEKFSDFVGQKIKIYLKAVERFPSREKRLLPTAFGNAIRAFEDYPEDIYGLDAVVSWVRLLGVIPKDFRELINTARCVTDFWMNLVLISYLIIIEYAIIVLSTGQIRVIWAPLLMLGFAFFASRRTVLAAVMWGDFVKSSYDLYLPDLRDKLQLPVKKTTEEEKALWNEMARQFLYHQAANIVRQSRTEESQSDKKQSISDEE